MPLLKNVRFYVLLSSLALSLGIYLGVKQYVPAGMLQTIRLTQVYALTAALDLYLALLIGPLVYRWHSMPARGYVYRARRAIGVSTFYFACLHAYLAFFKQLGGFGGLGFLSGKYLLAIGLSFTALVILLLMASTSFDKMVQKLTFKRWKILHRFIYLAGVLILIHALMLGTHFQDLSAFIPQISFVALAFLLILQAQRFDAWLQHKIIGWPHAPISFIIVIIAIICWLVLLFFPAVLPSLGIHGRHAWLSQSALAHVLEADDSVGAILHVYPDDQPVAGQPSTLFFTLRDKAGVLSATNCDCTISIVQADKAFTTQPLSRSSFSFIFPQPGDYQISISGHSFTLAYSIHVAPAQAASQRSDWFSIHFVHLAAAGGIAVIGGGAIIREHFPKK